MASISPVQLIVALVVLILLTAIADGTSHTGAVRVVNSPIELNTLSPNGHTVLSRY
ncbi:MAG: hypothetical protein IPN09_11755 [Bacteroidetes bacterium]|nr:hypothetical protein [Bacteroidota bacterium]